MKAAEVCRGLRHSAIHRKRGNKKTLGPLWVNNLDQAIG